MYTKKVPFKDIYDRPQNGVIHFNLFEREVFKLLVEFQAIFKWQESIQGVEIRELPTEEVVAFYNNFEEILLAAYGVPADDGLAFHKGGRRYEFEETALFNACMVEYLADPKSTQELLDGLLPKDLQEIVKRADANMAEMAKDGKNPELELQIAQLRAQLAEAESGNKQQPESSGETE